jgi:hypothetical protein
MELAHSIGIRFSNISEWAALEHEVDSPTPLDPFRAKSAPGDLCFEKFDSFSATHQFRCALVPVLTTYLAWALSTADGVA